MVWDACPEHRSQATREAARQAGVRMLEVPRGCTSVAQAPDLLWFGGLKARWFCLTLMTFTLAEAYSAIET